MDFILSDGSSVNSHGFSINLSGGDFERFKKNPVMLYMHDDENVIGKWDNLRVEDNKLIATAVFDVSDEAKEIERKATAGILKGCSMSIYMDDINYDTDNPVVNKWELIEASIVSIPSDAGAVKLYNRQNKVLNFSFNNKNKQKEMGETVFKLSEKARESLSLGADYTSKEVELAVAEKDKVIEALKAELKATEKQAQTDYLAQAVKSGKITEAERLSFEKMADKGCFDDVKVMLDGKSEKATDTLANKVSNRAPGVEGRETWNYLKWMKEDSEGLKKLKLDNPKAFERLQLAMK